jgi:hypothetical protein
MERNQVRAIAVSRSRCGFPAVASPALTLMKKARRCRRALLY